MKHLYTYSFASLHVNVRSDAKAIIARLVHLAHHHAKVEEWSISPYASPRPRYTLPPLPAFRPKQVCLQPSHCPKNPPCANYFHLFLLRTRRPSV